MKNFVSALVRGEIMYVLYSTYIRTNMSNYGSKWYITLLRTLSYIHTYMQLIIIVRSRPAFQQLRTLKKRQSGLVSSNKIKKLDIKVFLKKTPIIPR